MNVIQSYLTTIIKGNFSLYETRLFSRIVLQANQALHTTKFSKVLGKAYTADGVNLNMSVPITDLITTGSHDYQQVIDAAKSLQDKVIEYYDRREKRWTYYRDHVINTVRYKEGSGIINFTISVWLVNYILDFIGSNFSMYDFQQALRLPSAYAVRLYWLTCSMNNPVTYPVQMLREMLGVGDKYQQNRDFLRRCIDTPCDILRQHNVNGFRWEKAKGKGKSLCITLYPVKRQEESREQLTAMATLSAWVNPAVKNYLLSAAYFDNRELSANKSTLMEFSGLPDCAQRIVRIVGRAKTKGAGKGYIINAMKRATADFHKEHPDAKTPAH